MLTSDPVLAAQILLPLAVLIFPLLAMSSSKDMSYVKDSCEKGNASHFVSSVHGGALFKMRFPLQGNLGKVSISLVLPEKFQKGNSACRQLFT